MEMLIDNLQDEVRKQTCPVHQMKPSIKINDGSVETEMLLHRF